MIVGLLGFIGSGKGTAGTILKKYNFQNLSFASGVKDVTAVMFNWPREMLEGDTEASRLWREEPDEYWSQKIGRDFTPREALQKMGTEVGRNTFNKNFWVDRLEKHIGDDNYVITDCRFQNEVEFIHKKNGILIEIQRGIKPHWYTIAAAANRGGVKEINYMHNDSGIHPSEWSWIGCDIDYTIDNSGSVADLEKKLLECLTKSYGDNTIRELTQGVI